MKKGIALLVAALMFLPGCGGCGCCGVKGKKKVTKKKTTKKKTTKKKATKKKTGTKKVAFQEVNIPLVDDFDEDFKSYFDGDVNEFALLDDDINDAELGVAENIMISEIEAALADDLSDDFFWVEDVDEVGDTFKTVFFDFGQDGVRNDQEGYVKANIDLAKRMLSQGETPTIVVEGNSCSSAGSREYNLVLSNNRADRVAQRFVSEGFPRENIRVVGRGVDNPVVDEAGNPVTGDKDAQWANRRVEVRIYA